MKKIDSVLPITVWPLKQLSSSLPAITTQLQRVPKVTLTLFALWLASMIALPLVNLGGSESALVFAVGLNVFMQAALVLTVLAQAWGVERTAWAAAVVVLLTWAIEATGTATGLPFGLYHYTDKLQPQLAHVPLIIPMAWLIMLPPAWAVAYKANRSRYGFSFILLSGLALTAWDLFIDPQMVGWGFWVWDQPGGYFGIPWLNFFGWALSGIIITAIVKPRNLPVTPLLIIYTIIWALQTLGLLFFWGLPGPALVGFAGMGVFVWLAWRAR